MDLHSTNVTNHGITKSSKVIVRQIPKDAEWSQFESFLKQFGEVMSCEKVGNPDSPTAIVMFKNNEDAHIIIEKLNGHDYNGYSLKASMAVDKARQRGVRQPTGGGNYYGGGRPTYEDGPSYYSNQHGIGRPVIAEMPVRMVVNAKFVGAIIGQGGSNIRQITKDTKARCVVDVSRGLRDSSGNVEKIINIYGIPENTSKACIKILEIIQREFSSDQANLGKTPECELKLRAHNSLVGRLIGKGGGTIKKIMEETGCTVIISSIGELSAFNMDRTITIRGTTLEKISQAEQRISNKLRQCFEHDVANAPHTMYGGLQSLVSGMHPFGPPTAIDPYAVGPASFSPSVNTSPYSTGPTPISTQDVGQPPTAFILPPHQMTQNVTSGSFVPPIMSGVGGQISGIPAGAITEVVHIWVPNNMVGALIGTRGSHIRNVMRSTGAHVRIESGTPISSDGEQQLQQQHQQHSNDIQTLPNGATELDHAQQHQRGRSVGRSSDSHQATANGGSTERRVTITGTDQQQYKAQFWIFQRICEQGYHFFDEVRLCTEIQVPSKLIGRIIGKNGQNVRELQRLTGAVLKIPDDVVHDSLEDTIVRIIGNFNASQAVQSRIRQLTHQMQQIRPVNVQ